MKKIFRLAASEIRRLIPQGGSCLVSDWITVDGKRVGYMYRELAENEIDSGWRIFAGDESDSFCANPANFELMELNTIANYDPEIVSLLHIDAPCAFERHQNGQWQAVTPTFET